MRLRSAVCLACLVSLLLARPVHAQEARTPHPTENARTLFEAGLAHVDEGAWREAEAEFRKALALRASPVIRYNLAVTLSELGQLVEAATLLSQVDQDLGTTPALRAQLPDLLETLARRTPTLTITLEGATEHTAVLIDERPLARDALGIPQRLDPGSHTVQLREGKRALTQQTLELPEGRAEQLVLRVPRTAHVPPPSAAAASVAPDTTAATQVFVAHDDVDQQARKRRRRWGLALGGVAVVAGVLTAVLVARRRDSSTNDSDFNPPVLAVEVPE